MNNAENYLRAHYEESEDFIVHLLLRGTIRLADIPFHVRAANGVYVAAMRVSREFYNRFTEDLKIIMSNIERLPADYRGNYQNNLRDVFLKFLDEYFGYMCPFTGVSVFEQFRKEFYEPFLQKTKKCFNPLTNAALWCIILVEVLKWTKQAYPPELPKQPKRLK